MSMQNDDVYIQLLRLAREDLKNHRGISLLEFTERTKKFGLEEQVIHLYRDIYNPVFPQTQGMPTKNFISMSSYLKLLEYDELAHSLHESKQARREAKFAIIVAIGLGTIEIVISLLC